MGEFILRGTVTKDAPEILHGFQRMQKAGSAKEVIDNLNEYKNLPWETIPTQFLKEPEVWKKLFYNGAIGQTALVRNVTRFGKIGAFNDLVFVGDVAEALADEQKILKGRMHPVQYANALGVYGKGSAQDRGVYFAGIREPEVAPNAKILGALESGFYNSFKAVTPANKATMISLDVSGSMTWHAPAGLVGMNYMEAAAVMAMVTLRTEPYAIINAFADDLQEVNISDKDSLDTVVRKLQRLSFGRTNCAKPMLHAASKGLGIDSFFVYTDNETWAGNVKPHQALQQYRNKSGREARLAVVAMAATPFTIADKNDRGMMDVVGFDSNAPKVLADFSAGRI